MDKEQKKLVASLAVAASLVATIALSILPPTDAVLVVSGHYEGPRDRADVDTDLWARVTEITSFGVGTVQQRKLAFGGGYGYGDAGAKEPTVTFPGLSAGVYEVIVFADLSHDGNLDTGLEPVASLPHPVAVGKGDKTRIELLPRELSARVAGHAVACDDHSPLESATIVLQDPFGVKTYGKSDGHGFVVEDVPTGVDYALPYDVAVEKAGFEPASLHALDVHAPDQDAGTACLHPNFLEGSVVAGDTFEPLADAYVRLEPLDSSGAFDETYTDETGAFSLRAVPIGAYLLTASVSDIDYGIGTLEAEVPFSGVFYAGEIVVDRLLGSLHGHVRHTATHEPFEGAEVELSDGPSGLLYTVTDSDGSFKFHHVAPGEYVLRAYAAGYLTVKRDLVLDAEDAALDEDVLLSKEIASVRARVVDDATGKSLSFYASLSGPGGDFDGDFHGELSFADVIPGTYTLRIESEGYDASETLALVKAPSTDLGEIRLAKTTASLVGSVADAATGHPLAGALVSLAGGHATKTDDEGAFRFHGLAPGVYKLLATHAGYASYTLDGVDVVPPETDLGVIHLEPVPACLVLCLTDGTLVAEATPEEKPFTDLHVAFSAEVVESGSYYFVVEAYSPDGSEFSTQTTTGTVALEKGVQNFRVHLSTDDIVASAVDLGFYRVNAYRADGEHLSEISAFLSPIAIDDFRGPAIELTPEGIEVEKLTEDGDLLFETVLVRVSFTADREVAAIFEATLESAQGEPIPGATALGPLEIFAEGPRSIDLRIDAGTVALEGIDPARVRVTAYSESYSTISKAVTTFEGGKASDYQAPPLRILAEEVKVIRDDLDQNGLVDTLSVTFVPDVAIAGDYRFQVELWSTGGSFQEEIDLAPYAAGASPLGVAFDGKRIHLAFPDVETFDVYEVAVYAFDGEWSFLDGASVAIDPAIPRAGFERGTPPIELPAADSGGIVVTCDTVDTKGVACLTENRGTSGFTALNVVVSAIVHESAKYAFQNQLLTSGEDLLQDEYSEPLPFDTGERSLELRFRGSEIHRRGVTDGVGDPAKVKVRALDEFYHTITSTFRTLTGLRAEDFETAIVLEIGGASITEGDLAFPVEVTRVGSVSGPHVLSGVLLTADYDYVTYADAAVDLTSGKDASSSISFNGREIRAFLEERGLAGAAFRLLLYLSDETYVTLAEEEALTGEFAVGAFPAPDLRFGGAPTVSGADTNANGLFDELRVTAPLAPRAGLPSTEFDVSISLYGGDGSFVTGIYDRFNADATTTEVPATLGTFDGATLRALGIDGPYTVYVSLYDAHGEWLGYRDAASEKILASQFDSGGVRVLGLAESTLAAPTGAAWLFDGIRLTATVAVEPAGTGNYEAYAVLYTDSWGLVGSAYEPALALDASTSSFHLDVDGRSVRSSGLDGPVRSVLYVYSGTTGRLVAFADGDSTPRTYRAGEFTPSSLAFADPASFTEAPSAANDAIEITAPVTVNQAGAYYLYAHLYTPEGAWIGVASAERTFAAEDLATTPKVTFSFSALDLLASGSPGPYSAWLSAYDASWALVAQTPEPFATKSYALDGWTVELPLEIGIVGDETAQRSEGLVTAIEVAVPVTVRAAGTYTVAGALLVASKGADVVLAGAAESFAVADGETGARTVTLRFDAEEVRFNLPAGLTSKLRIQLSAYREGIGKSQLLDTADRLTAESYSQGSFKPPPARASIVSYAWQGIDTTADSKFDVLQVTVGLDVAEAGFYRVDADLYGPDGRTYLASASTTATTALGTGDQSLRLSFAGGSIAAKGLDGKYRLAALYLYKYDGVSFTLVAKETGVISPTSFNAAQFGGA